MARVLVDSDTFDGAAGTMDAAWSSWRGTALDRDGGGNARLQVNSATNGSFRNTGTYDNNQYCEVEATGASDGGAGHNIDVGVRGQSAGNGYLVIVRTTGVDLYKVVADVFNLVANVAGAQTWIAGDLYSVEVQDNGSSQPVFKVYKNGAQLGTDIIDTGASPYTGGRPIVCVRQDSAPIVLIASWNGGNVVSASSTTQNGAATITLVANSAQSYAPASSQNTTQNGAATVTITSASRQGYNIRVTTSPDALVRVFGAQAGTPWASQSGIVWQWQDAWAGPVMNNGTDATDASGLLSVRIPATALNNGQGGRLTIELPDGNPPATWPRQSLYLPVVYG